MYTQKSREVQVQSAILDYLSAKRHFYFRTNNIPVFDKSRGTFRALPKHTHTPRGIADIIVVHVGRPYFLKLKRPGAYQRPEQKEFQKRAEDARDFVRCHTEYR
ncbi:MAG TPA: hypothetical protein VIJ79_17320 [Acidobacteriaceae bacterium]